MSVYIHVGQCGNQISEDFWYLANEQVNGKVLSTEYSCLRKNDSSMPTRYGERSIRKRQLHNSILPRDHLFHSSHLHNARARCILVDSEPKVIRSILQKGLFHPAHYHYEQSGRGNNWAMGYNHQMRQNTRLPTSSKLKSVSISTFYKDHKSNRQELMELILDSLQKEIEAMDFYEGSILMHSLAGGTGSGLGCRVMQNIRDLYPKSYLMSVSIAPSACGDTPLQNYNALFTLSKLQEYCDGIIYKDNDQLLQSVAYWKQLQNSSTEVTEMNTKKRISLQEMNHLVASDLAGLFFPISGTENFRFGKLIQDLCPIPATKFLDVRTGIIIPRPPNSSKKTRLLYPLAFHASIEQQDPTNHASMTIKTLRHAFQTTSRSSTLPFSSSVIVRGFKQEQQDLEREIHGLQELQSRVNTSIEFHPQGTLASTLLSSTICRNHGATLVPSAQNFLERAKGQFKIKAYVHWYLKHGLEEEDFGQAFEKTQKIIDVYSKE